MTDPFEVVHLLHAAHEVREWWGQPHDVMGKAVRAVAGPAAFERLPERFRTREAADEGLLQSRLYRARSGSGFLPRISAFVPPGISCRYTVEATYPTGATLVAESAPRTDSSDDLQTFAEHRRGRAPARPGPLAAARTFGHPGLLGRLSLATDPDRTHVDCYCDVGSRRYQAVLSPADGAAMAEPELLAALSVIPGEQPELRRLRGDIGVSDPGWAVHDALQLLAPDAGGQVAFTSRPLATQATVDDQAARHVDTLRQLPGFEEVGMRSGVVFGGRNGLRRQFRFRDGTQKVIGGFAQYYVELGRLFCAVEVVPAASPWGSKLDTAATRLTVI